MKNIEIFVKLREQINLANFIIEDIDEKLEMEESELNDLITANDEKVYELYDALGQINYYLSMLTEDIKEVIEDAVLKITGEEGFECKYYNIWCEKVKYDQTKLVELIETFEDINGAIGEIIDDTIIWYRVLTQDGYGTAEGVM